jgi:hypothetical protein
MIISQFINFWYHNWENFILILSYDIQEILVFKEAHGSITDVHILTSDTSDHPFEEFWYEMLHSGWVDYLQNFFELCQIQELLLCISKWPVLKKSFKKRDCKLSVLR